MESFKRMLPDERYRTDPHFRTLVDLLLHHIEAAAYTPTELREACHLAACIYENTHIRPLLSNPMQPFVWDLKKDKD